MSEHLNLIDECYYMPQILDIFYWHFIQHFWTSVADWILLKQFNLMTILVNLHLLEMEPVSMFYLFSVFTVWQ